MKIKFGNKELAILVIILIALFSFSFLGFVGFKTMMGFIVLFFLPFYLILDNFDLEMGEKIVFSFFIGVIMFPSLVYLLGLVMSVKISIIISFIVFTLIGLFLKKFSFKRDKITNDNQN